MKCPNCGSESSGRFCQYCGAPLTQDTGNSAKPGNPSPKDDQHKESGVSPQSKQQENQQQNQKQQSQQQEHYRQNSHQGEQQQNQQRQDHRKQNYQQQNYQQQNYQQQNYQQQNYGQQDYQQQNYRQQDYQQQNYRQQDYQQPDYRQQRWNSTRSTSDVPPEYKPITMWGYFGYEILFSIPCIGLILLLIFSFGGTQNVNLKNFARSYFCFLIIVVIVVVIFASIMGLGSMAVMSSH